MLKQMLKSFTILEQEMVSKKVLNIIRPVISQYAKHKEPDHSILCSTWFLPRKTQVSSF